MKRINIQLSDELHEYYKKRSKRTGISMSALMAMQLEREYNDDITMKSLPELIEAYNDLVKGAEKK